VDLFYVHRYVDQNIEMLVRDAKRHGVTVVWDEDDDLGALPKHTKGYQRVGGLRWEKRLAGMKRMFSHVDLVTTPSTELAERLRSYGASNVQIIENHVPGMFLQARRQHHEGVMIGWVAGTEHHLDVEQLPIVSVLNRILEERTSVHVMTLGVKLPLDPTRYAHIATVPPDREYHRALYPRALSSGRGQHDWKAGSLGKLLPGGIANFTAMFDIGIAPLVDIPLNRSRSNIKLKEYAAGGTPWLASPVGPYRHMGVKQGGAWLQTIGGSRSCCAWWIPHANGASSRSMGPNGSQTRPLSATLACGSERLPTLWLVGRDECLATHNANGRGSSVI
jgi:hypothetical protein